MVNFVLEKETERKIQKKFNVSSNPINSRKAQEQKKQIVYSLNDPHNISKLRYRFVSNIPEEDDSLQIQETC